MRVSVVRFGLDARRVLSRETRRFADLLTPVVPQPSPNWFPPAPTFLMETQTRSQPPFPTRAPAPSVLGAEAGLWAPSAAGREDKEGGGLPLGWGPLQGRPRAESSAPTGSFSRH